jgi:uncharacterized protein DUF5677
MDSELEKDVVKYNNSVLELEALFEVFFKLVERNEGLEINSWEIEYLNGLCVKFSFHLSSILKLLPGSKFYLPIYDISLIDYSSVCVLSRSMIETFFKLLYILMYNEDTSLKAFKHLILEYHSEKKRLILLKYNRFTDNKKFEILDKEVKDLWEKIIGNSQFPNFEKFSKHIKKANRAFLFSDEEICDFYDFSLEYYKMIFQYLSQYIHPMPYGLKQLYKLSESINDIYLLLNTTLTYCIVFVHLMIHYCVDKVDRADFQLPTKLISDIESSFYIIRNFSKDPSKQ